MVPIEKDLIDQSLLNRNEINWLNEYHQKVFHNLKYAMNKRRNFRIKKSLFSYLRFFLPLFFCDNLNI